MVKIKPLDAPNAFSVDFPYEMVRPFYKQFKVLVEEVDWDGVAIYQGKSLYSYRPGWNGDLTWISPSDEYTFRLFEEFFYRSELPSSITNTEYTAEIKNEVRMYSGFFVTRSICTRPHWHTDYNDGCGTNAWTSMSPVALPVAQEGHLLYKDNSNKTQQYVYRRGEAVVFGEKFNHSTEPLRSPVKTTFLCFTFGTDRQKHWKHIAATAGSQGVLCKMPNGKFSKSSPSQY